MPTITVRNEEGEIVEKEIVSRRAVIAEFTGVDAATANTDDLNVLLEPAVPQRIEYDDEGGMSQITTVCGETENRRESDKGATYVLEGIITQSQLSAAKNLKNGDNLTLVSDLHSGPITVQRTTIEQNNELIHFSPDSGSNDQIEEQELAYTFQMQFKEPDTTA